MSTASAPHTQKQVVVSAKIYEEATMRTPSVIRSGDPSRVRAVRLIRLPFAKRRANHDRTCILPSKNLSSPFLALCFVSYVLTCIKQANRSKEEKTVSLFSLTKFPSSLQIVDHRRHFPCVRNPPVQILFFPHIQIPLSHSLLALSESLWPSQGGILLSCRWFSLLPGHYRNVARR